MYNKNRINKLRRVLMRSLTKDVGTTHTNVKREGDTNASIKKILVSRPNHRLGNQLLLTPLIDELEATFPGCSIDVFVRGGLAHVLFKNYTSVSGVFKLPKRPLKEIMAYLKVWRAVSKADYDLAINVARGSSSGRMSIQRAKARYKLFGDLPETAVEKYPDHMHMAKHPVYVLRTELAKLGFEVQDNPVPVMDLRLDGAELSHAKAELDKLVSADKKTISIFTYATGSKCYTPEWWLPVYEKLKTHFPDYNIVEVLPAENVSQIHFAAPTFYSHDVREIASFIANTAVFIGADSGIMHLASAAKAPTVGLFSVTDATKYGPYGNGSIAVNTNNTDADGLVEAVAIVLKNNS
ncbi:glycosyltransferase family 9 protein [Flavobacterium psychrotrophum]|uniref:glycosyltransferase family 9 protein n=1 Tax=Flavobacterium psychrotrophum TaxID=2294119 RepID=UPI000E30FB9F|nr:glycosyltransferase family 9 protein [Flavobacterium psychrotrophum]